MDEFVSIFLEFAENERRIGQLVRLSGDEPWKPEDTRWDHARVPEFDP